jgi:hypothetical protein
LAVPYCLFRTSQRERRPSCIDRAWSAKRVSLRVYVYVYVYVYAFKGRYVVEVCWRIYYLNV